MGYLFYTFKKEETLYTEVAGILGTATWQSPSWEIWLCIVLMPINWSLEGFKWKLLASKIETISFSTALKGTLAGLGLGFITPHAIGDYVARIYFLNLKHKTEALGAVLLSRISMFFVSIFYGILAFYILTEFKAFKTSLFFDEKIMLFILACSILLFIILLHFNIFERINYKQLGQKWIIWFWNSLKIITQYSLSDLSVCLLLSFLRYTIFTFQYLLLLQFLGIDIYNILIVSAVWMIFFTKTVFPNFNILNDLGIREVASVYFLSELGVPSSTAIVASLSLWVINILIPTISGVFVLIGTKYKKVEI